MFLINYELSSEMVNGKKRVNPLTTNVSHHIETGQLICSANQLTGFYMTAKYIRIESNTFSEHIRSKCTLYPPKTSENHKVFCFQGAGKGCIGSEWVNLMFICRNRVFQIVYGLICDPCI